MPRKVFVANEILTAGDVNTNLMDQAVMTFADAAARTAALGSPSEGMVTYLEDTDSLELYTTVWGPVSPAITPSDLPAGSVLQVVSTTLTSVFSASVAADALESVTGLSATITPVSSSSKILVFGAVSLALSDLAQNPAMAIFRGGAVLPAATGDAAGSRFRLTSGGSNAVTASGISPRRVSSVPFSYEDSPATTSATTYGVGVGHTSGSTTTVYVNRAETDTNSAAHGRWVSTITLMEVAG